MCHNSLSEPCPHLVSRLMGISIIGFPIMTPLTSSPRILSPPPSLLLTPPNTARGPSTSVWNKCQTRSVNSHKHGSHTERQVCNGNAFLAFPLRGGQIGCAHFDWRPLWSEEDDRTFIADKCSGQKKDFIRGQLLARS